jgi:histidinol dehydrogenase
MRLINKHQLADILKRQRQQQLETESRIRTIVDAVAKHGDEAVRKLTKKFDGVILENLEVPIGYLKKSLIDLNKKDRVIIAETARRIKRYHEKQRIRCFTIREKAFSVSFKSAPLARVGIYIPAGQAPLVSSVLMTAIPAQVAGVREIIVCSPPSQNGTINHFIAAALYMLGLKKVFRIGGAQAIAAMAFGTESVPAVDKVVGPGNEYVNAAKKLVAGITGIDMLAGPSELAVLADKTGNARFIIADLKAQHEHNGGNVFFITTSEKLGRYVASVVEDGWWIKVASIAEGVELVNKIAPEHLEIITRDAEKIACDAVAGAIFLGNYSPCAMGDYFAGPSHTLPTGGSAARKSGLSVLDFVRTYAVMRGTKEFLVQYGGAGERLAEIEGLIQHKNSLAVRRRKHNGV